MNTAVSRNRSGLDAATKKAARRAGKTLDESIDEAVREKSGAAASADETRRETGDPLTGPALEAQVSAILRYLQARTGSADQPGESLREPTAPRGRNAASGVSKAAGAERVDAELARLHAWLETGGAEVDAPTHVVDPHAEQPRAMERAAIMRQIGELRREVESMASDLDRLTPRTSATAVQKMLRDLEDLIACRRREGVSDAALRSATQVTEELRAVVEDMGAGHALRAIRADIDCLGDRVDALDRSGGAHNVVLRDLTRETQQIRAQIAALATQRTPLEKVEIALEALIYHVEALAAVGQRATTGASIDVARIEDDLRDVVAQEVAGGMASFNLSIENLAKRLDGTVDGTFSKRLEQFGERIDALGETLVERESAQKIERARVIETVMNEIGEKIDRIDRRVDDLPRSESLSRIESALAHPIYDQSFEDLSRRLDQMHERFAQTGAARGEATTEGSTLAKQLENFTGRIERALDPGSDASVLKTLEAQIAEIAGKLEKSQPAAALIAEMNDRMMQLVAEIAELKVAARMATQTQPHEQATVAESAKALHAVHDMFEKLLERFGACEEVLTFIREEAGYDRVERHAPSIVDPTVAAPVISAAEPSPPVMPPSSARVEHEAIIADVLTDEYPDIASNAATPSSFIAAARRAARQAAADADIVHTRRAQRRPPRAPREESGVHASGRNAFRNSIFDALVARKRTLFAMLGAVALIAGAYHLAGADVGSSTTDETAMNERPAYQEISPEPTRDPGSVGQDREQADNPTAAASLTNEPAAPPTKFTNANRLVATARQIDPAPVSAIAPAQKNATRTKTEPSSNIVLLANDGVASAQFELASRYMDGRDVTRDPALAAQWFEKAARQGFAPAQFRLGSMYEKGVGVERDYATARKWYNSAASAGNARAMHNLAVLMIEGEDAKPLYAAAAQWFRKAAEYGVRDSQYNLAILYARGLGVERSFIESYRWFEAAARQGDADSAKKRDEVAARLSPAELEKARALINGFEPKTPPPEANDVPVVDATTAPMREPTPAPSGGKAKVSQAQPFS